jgi:hypothetical protein
LQIRGQIGRRDRLDTDSRVLDDICQAPVVTVGAFRDALAPRRDLIEHATRCGAAITCANWVDDKDRVASVGRSDRLGPQCLDNGWLAYNEVEEPGTGW